METISGSGCVEVHILRRDLVGKLAQRRNIIKNPERPAVRGQNKLVVFHHQVVNRRSRQVELQRAPVCAVIERNEHTSLGAGIKQPAFLGVFADCTYKRVLWNAAYDSRPALAVVVGLIDVRTQVVILVAVNRQVGSSGIVRRGVDEADTAPFRQILRSDV